MTLTPDRKRQARVLVLDGSRGAEASPLARVFRDHGAHVVTAETESALAVSLESEVFDLLVVDAVSDPYLPSRLFKTVRENLGLEGLPIALIARGSDEGRCHDMDPFRIIAPDDSADAHLRSCVDWIREDPPGRLCLGEAERDRFARLLGTHSGMRFDNRRQNLLQEALQARMRVLGCGSFAEYYTKLISSPGSEAEIKRLILLLTVGETYFLRNLPHFETLAQHVLPAIVEGGRNALCRIRLWSAGCSTGEEPYSLAMALSLFLENHPSWDFEILATDINSRSLRIARNGNYSERALRASPLHFVDRYLKREGDRFEILPELRRKVRFKYLNLKEGAYPQGMDIIFCRNVLIYFDRPDFEETVHRFHDALVPGGYLFLGHSENLMGVETGLESVHAGRTFFYRKPLSRLSRKGSPRTSPAREREVRRRRAPARPAPPRGPQRRPLSPPCSQRKATEREASSPPPSSPKGGTEERELFLEGMGCIKVDDTKAAERLFDELLSAHPGSALGHSGKAFLLASRGDRNRARHHVEQALTHGELMPEVHFINGLILESEGDDEAAIDAYDRTLFLEPAFLMAHVQLGMLDLKKRRPHEADLHFSNAMDLLERGVPAAFSGWFTEDELKSICRVGISSAQDAIEIGK